MSGSDVIIEQEITVVEVQPLEYEISVSAVGERGPAGPVGPQGPVGPVGPAGPAGDGSGIAFVQNSPLAQWTITHALGYHPNVTVVDSGGTVVEGELQYVDITTILATFSNPFSGIAYLS